MYVIIKIMTLFNSFELSCFTHTKKVISESVFFVSYCTYKLSCTSTGLLERGFCCLHNIDVSARSLDILLILFDFW